MENMPRKSENSSARRHPGLPAGGWLALLAAAASLTGPACAQTPPPRMSADLARQVAQYPTSNSPKDVIVRFAVPGVNATAIAQACSGLNRSVLPLIGGAAMRVPY